MKIFVTGGSGFIGGHLIEALVRQGHEVLALARSEKAAAVVRGYGAVPVRGELGAVKPEMIGGAEVVIHSAAFAEEWGTREEFWQANVVGTTNLLESARAGGVRRFVHVGTEAALFEGKELRNVDESTPYPARHQYLYAETKAEAERQVLAAATTGFATVSIRPRLVWGPRDATVLPVVLRMASEGSFAWIDGGVAQTSTTHVDNLVHALLLSLTKGESGRAYFVADDGERTMRVFMTALARTRGVELGGRSVPSVVARPLARLIEGVYRLFGVRKAPPMTRLAIDMLASSVTINTARARRELGYAPVITVETGLSRLREAAAA